MPASIAVGPGGDSGVPDGPERISPPPDNPEGTVGGGANRRKAIQLDHLVMQYERMVETVVASTVDVSWEPNVPHAVVVSNDTGRACLVIEPHFDDEDQRKVVLVWTGCQAVRTSPCNDEARHLHPLYQRGLRDLPWLGEVENSQWLASNASLVTEPARRHFVVPLKECLVEVLADDLLVQRLAGSTGDAVLAALHHVP